MNNAFGTFDFRNSRTGPKRFDIRTVLGKTSVGRAPLTGGTRWPSRADIYDHTVRRRITTSVIFRLVTFLFFFHA